ncbi:MAG: DMT family transporter [Hyphomicrobium sp.]
MPPAENPAHTERHSNTVGILAMLAGMAFFTANDTCVKLIGEKLPLGELIVLRNVASTAYILAFAAVFGGLTLPRHPPVKPLIWRMIAEAASTLLFLSALIAMPIADATAIMQVLPLAITVAAAVYLKEPVGWRHWLAAIAGLCGVLLIAKPGTSAFNPAALLLLLAVGLVVARDLLTRVISNSVPTLTLTLMSAAAVAPSGLLLLPFETWVWPGPRELLLLAIGGACLTLAYALVIVAMRAGEVAVISPFRYAVILFAIFAGWLVWDETPDGVQLLGIAVLTAAGIYTVHRERRMAKRA